ncbi:FAD-dependent oxidoreductase [Curtobacterium albidum]|uniref:ferredoxin--NADP(+) reductase n=1 Tax=Curtobacterium citreum TaxID=2036 RepID=A0A850DUR4_9MICO|nr:FAD-dependent oxidoreductase [Curtobacterium albidum]
MNPQPHASGRAPSIAVVGSGPSGCYTALALSKKLPGSAIVVFDASPTPYGLLRSGIAADHQGMKGAARQFDRMFASGKATFVGGVRIGDRIGLDDLTAAFDAVVVATGLAGDRPLAVPGGDLDGVYGAGDVVRLLNGHADAALRHQSRLRHRGLGTDVLVVGTGNVAVDVVRLLTKSDLELHGSDIDDDARSLLRADDIRSIRILGRGPADKAKWDPAMFRELADVAAIRMRVDGQAVAEVEGSRRVDVDVHFEASPTLVHAAGDDYDVTVRTSHGTQTHRVGAVITATGFVERDDIPWATIPTADLHRVYRAGGCDTGVLGNLGENRTSAGAVAATIAATIEIDDHRRADPLAALRDRLPADAVSYEDWQHIDAEEVRRAPAERCRWKFTDSAELYRALAHAERPAT